MIWKKRTAKFGEETIKFSWKIKNPHLNLTDPTKWLGLVQVSSTILIIESGLRQNWKSISSFIIWNTTKKEAKETRHWLRIVAWTNQNYEMFVKFYIRNQKLQLIFISIIKKSMLNKINFDLHFFNLRNWELGIL